MTKIDHLALAKENLAIAESADAKREAYVRAANHIATHIEVTGDTQVFVATKIERKEFYVSKLLAWRKAGYPDGTTPFTMADPSGSKPTDRAAKSHAKKVLSDPEQRREVIESLPEEDRLEIAREAMSPTMKREERGAKERRAHRESQSDHDRTHVELITNRLGVADIAILEAIRHAKDTTWTPDGAALVEARIEQTEERLNLLRTGVQADSGEVDWDAALAKLGEST